MSDKSTRLEEPETSPDDTLDEAGLENARSGAVSRLIMVLMAPQRFFTIKGWQDGFWVPLLVVAVALAGLKFVQLPELRTRITSPEFRTGLAQERNITEDEAARMTERMAATAPVYVIVEAPIMIVAGAAGLALALSLIGRIVFKQRVPYPELFGLASWTGLVAAIPLALHIPLQLLNPEWILPTNPAALMPDAWQANYFARVAMAVDAFLIWQVWLISLGSSRIFGVTLHRAVSAVGTLFVCFAVLNAMLTGPKG